MLLRSIIICVFSLITSLSFSQPSIFQNAQGINKENVSFYDTEGYRVFFEEYDFDFNEKGINKLKKRFSIPKKTLAFEDPDFPNVKVFTNMDTSERSPLFSVYYLSATNDGKIKAVGFSTLCDRDVSIERDFYYAILSNEIPQEIFTSSIVDTIMFAGRKIELGPICQWMDIRNVQCPGLGQMNWSEFSDSDRARQMIAAQKALNANVKMGEILAETELLVNFEGQKVTATKRTQKVKIPKFMMGGSNILIIYYVVAEVRGRYIAAVLSHYSDQAEEGKLPPLLGEVMELVE